MAEHAVLILNQVAAKNVDAWNRSAVTSSSAVDIENGNVFRLLTKSTTAGKTEAWAVTACDTSGSVFESLWMAYSPEITTLSNNGKYYRGREFGVDPRDFTNLGTYVFDAFKPQVGDIITLSAAGISGSPSSGTYASAITGSYQLVWGTSAGAGSALSFKLIKQTYMSLANGTIDDQREMVYELECVAN